MGVSFKNISLKKHGGLLSLLSIGLILFFSVFGIFIASAEQIDIRNIAILFFSFLTPFYLLFFAVYISTRKILNENSIELAKLQHALHATIAENVFLLESEKTILLKSVLEFWTFDTEHTYVMYVNDDGRNAISSFKSVEIIYEGRDIDMDPILLTSLLGSVASIVSLLQQNSNKISPKMVLKAYRAKAVDLNPIEASAQDSISDEQVLSQATLVLSLGISNKKFLDRILERCLKPFYDKIDDYEADEADVAEAHKMAAKCVCANIKMAMDQNGGAFPSPEFKELWKQYGCS